VSALRTKLAALTGRQLEPHGPFSLEVDPPEATLSHLAGGIGRLYSQVGRADVAPTVSQTAALAALEKDYALVMGRWKAIQSVDLPALNRQLSGGGLPEIKLTAEPAPASESEDEE